MTKTYTKDDKEEKILIEETKTELRKSQYTIKELKDIIADLNTKLSEWQEALSQAQTLGVKESITEIQ